MIRQDRRELSFLGALLLGWALVAAPIVHRFAAHAEEHTEGHGHSHGPVTPAPSSEHGQGSLEHGQALFTASPGLPSLVLVVVALAVIVVEVPGAPSLPAWPRVEKSQGP